MTAYKDVPFEALTPGGMHPLWNQETHIVRTHYPYSDQDDVQYLGRGNKTVKVLARFATLADLEAMRALAGLPGAGAIDDLFGASYATARLLGLRVIEIANVGGLLKAELEFDLGGAAWG